MFSSNIVAIFGNSAKSILTTDFPAVHTNHRFVERCANRYNMRFHIPRFRYSKRFKHFSLKCGRGRLRKVLAASSFCHHSVANASHRYEVQRSQRGPRAEHQTFNSRSRSIETLSRFFAIPQVASFAALAIRLSKFILQTHVLVSLAPRYYEQ